MAEPKTESLLVVDDVRTCFVIMPFRIKTDVARSDEVNFDRVYEDIIKRGVERLNNEGLVIKCIRSDEVERAGLIQERMIEYIADADVAVVDITSQNPNVFYELGVRHALRDRVTVLLRRKGTSNPFNIAGMTAITGAIVCSRWSAPAGRTSSLRRNFTGSATSVLTRP